MIKLIIICKSCKKEFELKNLKDIKCPFCGSSQVMETKEFIDGIMEQYQD